ncbi:hypothetical protein [Nocardia pseudobrasiliensis]|uniref:Uncharacterized protein n=1 Tax=Nocardia pseudobrasiliensis TaxID=45979 RepID=A0A370I782_9NOCA|nr:hypothetical protein [Nocardia pseudobrasiliensis]RDI66587.1 hypothetical protein DFR76_104337 [Nocardia pseudobrasiliensis]
MAKPQEYEQTYKSGLSQARVDLERFLKEDGNSSFSGKGDQAIWNDKPKTTGTDVKTLLDDAAPGLQWFELALIRFHRVHGVVGLSGFDRIDVPPLSLDGEQVGAETIVATTDPVAEIRRLEFKWYDQQRSMNLASLRQLADSLRKASTSNDSHPSAEDVTRDLNGVATAVPEVWQGTGGVAAQDHLAGLHAHADQQTQYLQSVTAALDGLPDVLLQIVRDKADFIARFDSPQCPVAGHAMRLSGGEDPVSNIITVAAESTTTGYLLGSTNARAAEQFHMTDVGPGSSDGAHKIREACRTWLSEHFGPAVREAFIAFVHQCALADYYIRRAYKPVTDLLDSHDATPFPKPQEQNPAPSQPTPSGTPTTPASTTPASTTPAATTPASTTPASATPTTPATTTSTSTQTNPLQTLSSLASQASQTVQQGLGQLESLAQQGLSSLTTNTSTTGTTDPSGSKTLATLDLPGGKLALAQASDGSLTATVTGPDGKSHEYSMGIKDGKPYFSENPEPATQPTTAAAAKESAPAGRAAGGGGAPAAASPSSHPAAGISYSGTPAASTPHTSVTQGASASESAGAATASTQSGAAMGGVPMGGMSGGGAAGGKGSADPERRSNGIIPPQPLWTTPRTDAEPVLDPAGSPELASAGNLDAEAATDGIAPQSPRNDAVAIDIELRK